MSVSPLRSRALFASTVHVRNSLQTGGRGEPAQGQIQQYYVQLHSQVQRLDSKVEEIIAKHENDFLSAFKVHIFGLQKQLLDLRRQLHEKDSTLYKDQQIQSLSNTVKWFHEEGLKFAEILAKSKQETEKWKSKAQALEADTNFLERQVKALKRKQRVWEQLKEQTQPRKEEASETEQPVISTKSTSSLRSLEFDGKAVTHSGLAEIIAKYDLRDASLCKDLDDLLKAQTSKCAEAIRHLQAALERKQRKLQIFTAQRAQFFATQSDLQRTFVDCVEEVRKHSQTAGQPAKALVDEDKRKIVEIFCLNDSVFQEIYDRLFPPSTTTMKSTPVLPKVKSDTSRSPSHTPKKGAFAALFTPRR